MKAIKTITRENKRLAAICIAIAALLSIPWIAMQFTYEINWSLSDFIVMGMLLIITGLGCEWVLRKASNRIYRPLLCLAILAVFLVTWAELAVGIF